MACKRFVGSIPIASTTLTRTFPQNRVSGGSESERRCAGSHGHHRSEALGIVAGAVEAQIG